MTAVETLTALMDKARQKTGLTEKISVPRLTGLMDHFDLHVNPNLLSTDYTNSWSVSPSTSKILPATDPIGDGKVKTSIVYLDGMEKSAQYSCFYYSQKVHLEKGKPYTLSLLARLAPNAPTNVYLPLELFSDYTDAHSGWPHINFEEGLHNTWTYYDGTFTVDETGDYKGFRILSYDQRPMPGGVLYLANIKLEQSDLATPLEKVGG